MKMSADFMTGHRASVARSQRVLGIVSIALSALALVFNAQALWFGVRHWGGVMGPLGLICLGCAMLVGPERRTRYRGLVAAGVLLSLLALVLVLSSRS
jgi:hypothetical protein